MRHGDVDFRELSKGRAGFSDVPEYGRLLDLRARTGREAESTDSSTPAPVEVSVRGPKRANLRTYREEDIPTIVRYVAEYLPTFPNYRYVKVHKQRLAERLKVQLTNQWYMLYLLEDESGIFAGASGFITPTDFSLDVVATDQYLFCDPAKRTLFNVNRLLRAYIDWAKAKGATIIRASQTSGIKPEAFKVLLERQGFRYIGNLYHLTEK